MLFAHSFFLWLQQAIKPRMQAEVNMAYQGKLWKSSVQIFGKHSFYKDFHNYHDKIAKYLRR